MIAEPTPSARLQCYSAQHQMNRCFTHTNCVAQRCSGEKLSPHIFMTGNFHPAPTLKYMEFTPTLIVCFYRLFSLLALCPVLLVIGSRLPATSYYINSWIIDGRLGSQTAPQLAGKSYLMISTIKVNAVRNFSRRSGKTKRNILREEHGFRQDGTQTAKERKLLPV